MRRWSIFLTALVGVLLASATPAALLDGLNGYSGPQLDVRAFGAVCDGSTDDKAKLDAAYDALTTNGGTIVIPAGKTCMVSADVEVESNVSLRCEPGGTIKATAGGTFTLGLLSWFGGFVARNNAGVTGCTFDLNSKANPAISVIGAQNPITRSRFLGGSTSNGSNWNMVLYNCSGAGCVFEQNTVTCANTSGAKDIGVSVAGSTTNGEQSIVVGNQVKGCDIVGINALGGKVQISTNTVTAIGTSGIGIESSASEGSVAGNNVNASGSSGVGINLQTALTALDNRVVVSGVTATGVNMVVSGGHAQTNRVTVSGASGVAFRARGCCGSISNNAYALTAVTGGTDDAIGIYLGDGTVFDEQYTVSGNVGAVTTTDAQVHVVIAAPLVTITGNIFTKGKYCIAPSQASAAEFSFGFNVTINANRCYSQGTSGIIAVTGFEMTGNYIAWVGSGGVAAIEVGDNRTLKNGTTHTLIVGNLIHSQESGVAGIKTNAIGKTCDGGTKQYQACTNDNTTDCPSATCPGCCDTNAGLAGVQVTGNHVLITAAGHGAGVDLSGVSSTSGDIYNWVIAGNTIETNVSNAADSTAAIKCSSSNQTKVHDIDIGTNSYNGYSPVTGDTTEGRIGLDCTPDMVDDGGTQMVWLPAAGCNNTTAYPAFDLPTSNAPSAVCAGSTYNRGFLSYGDGTDRSAFTNVALMDDNIHQVFVKPIYAVATANTLSTRWAFAATCFGDNTDYDAAWSADSTVDSAYNNNANDFEYPSSYSTVGAIGCGRAVLSLRTKRVGSNAVSGQDDQTQAALLYGVQLWIRKQD